MGVIRKIIKKVKKMMMLRNPVKYAISIGVTLDESVRLIGNPNWGSEPWLISIGAKTIISSDVFFSTHDGAVWVPARYCSKYKDVIKFGRIDIGKNCFIGARSIILPDVIIGDNCIVGAGSVVTKDIPSNEVWGGAPARRICSLEQYAERCFFETPDYDVENLVVNKKEESIIIADKRRLKRKHDFGIKIENVQGFSNKR